MDLTTTPPASVREKMHGIVQLKRTIEKGQAVAAGTNGEYHYNCPMDKHLFEFLGIDHEDLMDVIKSGSDSEIAEYVAPFVHAKSDIELETFNHNWVQYGPEPGSPSEKAFLELRNAVAPDRTDITSWTDLLDLDEKRFVPQRAAA
jgi:hypothetical protein